MHRIMVSAHELFVHMIILFRFTRNKDYTNFREFSFVFYHLFRTGKAEEIKSTALARKFLFKSDEDTSEDKGN